MNNWPEGWSDEDGAPQQQRRYGRGSAGAQPERARVMRHVQRGDAPPGAPAAPPNSSVPRQPAHGPEDHAGAPSYENEQDPGAAYDSGYNTGQVYESRGGRRGPGADGDGQGPGGPGGPAGQRPPKPPVNWKRRIGFTALTLAVVLLVTSVATYFWADSKLKREVDLSHVIERPEAGKGTNYLIVGSDSREGMSEEQKKELHTGSAEGKRTDSMMILHVGDNGNTMVSLPRDSNVRVPSFRGTSGKMYPDTGREAKLTDTYSMDGAELLVRIVEFNTGLRIDHYAEIGFAGFANIVDAVGGVEMDLGKGFKDKYSGADFGPGKQTLDGQQALAFVRTRHAFTSDLDRTKNQQKFLSALAGQTATPTTVMNPFKLYPVMGAGLDSLIVDKDMSLWDLSSMFWAMKGVTGGDGKSMNMPISGSKGANLVWDETKKKQLVEQLKNDEKVTVTGN
ncbi:LCP family protein [Streptomyces physcomitrii]|uniref:LCP family protein n=1 Tax=Streptomyces physcomitrii TaxID=2724184 RepID=A0ABX1HDS8_9ACTN|nr:LCP family protein [Streptomyces physcomitrii]NKI45329.1 LCP family protein [Streptomyces physcomitrii]